MRIGFFTPTYPGIRGEGGIGTYTRHTARALCAAGHQVFVLIPGDQLGAQFSDGLVQIHMTPTHHLPLVDRLMPGFGACYRIGRMMQHLVRRFALDVVEFPNWEGHGILFQALHGTPTVVRLHTSSRQAQEIDQDTSPDSGREARWDVRREKWSARGADMLVTHSHAQRTQMAKELSVNEDRICVVPHGIPIDPTFERPVRSSQERIILYVGRMEKRKGTLDLIRAIPTVLRQAPFARFVMVGMDRPHCPGGRTHAEFIRTDLPSWAQSRIMLLGRLPDDAVERWRQAADLFVVPSLFESFGLVVLEAMRWGTTVIGTRAGGIPEIIDDHRTGFLVPPGDSAALAQICVRLLHEDGYRRKVGDAGRRHVQSHFDINATAAKVAAVYHQTVCRCRKVSVMRDARSTSIA